MLEKEKYENILDGIGGGFFALDRGYQVIYWNRAAERGTGLSASDVLGRNVFEIFPNAKDATLGEKYRLAMETGTFQSIETAYKDDRFDAWYDIRIYPGRKGFRFFFRTLLTGSGSNARRKFFWRFLRPFTHPVIWTSCVFALQKRLRCCLRSLPNMSVCTFMIPVLTRFDWSLLPCLMLNFPTILSIKRW
jgi:PAS domain S-box-containing protein